MGTTREQAGEGEREGRERKPTDVSGCRSVLRPFGTWGDQAQGRKRCCSQTDEQNTHGQITAPNWELHGGGGQQKPKGPKRNDGDQIKGVTKSLGNGNGSGDCNRNGDPVTWRLPETTLSGHQWPYYSPVITGHLYTTLREVRRVMAKPFWVQVTPKIQICLTTNLQISVVWERLRNLPNVTQQVKESSQDSTPCFTTEGPYSFHIAPPSYQTTGCTEQEGAALQLRWVTTKQLRCVTCVV